MNVKQDTDTIDGKDPDRQICLAIVYIVALFVLWHGFKLLQYRYILFTSNNDELARNWIFMDSYMPWNVLLIGLLVLGVGNRLIGFEGENSVRVTTDLANPQTLDSGTGTRLILYTTGWFLKSITETRGFSAKIERERRATSGEFPCSIHKIELRMDLNFQWLPYFRRLSVFFQNGDTDAERLEILDSIIILAKEMTIIIASKMESTEHVRNGQREIADAVAEYIEPIAADTGFVFPRIGFNKCEYPPEVQKLLNSGLEAQTITGIAAELVAIGVNPDKAAELAAIYSKTAGVKIDRTVFELEMSKEISEAIGNAGPALASAAAAFTKSMNAKKATKPKPKK